MRWMFRPMAAVFMAVLVLTSVNKLSAAEQDQPIYTVVSTEGAFEIRDYETMVLAEFTMRGTYARSVNQGYIQLEQYFLGKNAIPEPIAITTPTMVRNDLSGGWTTIFFLPNGYTAETAPPPNDRRIKVIEFPPRRMAAITFRGKLNERAMSAQVALLEAWLEASGIAHKADFTLAGYHAPWVPASRRRNEVLVTLK
jgi:DNA gyrase inhibitor GyrI